MSTLTIASIETTVGNVLHTIAVKEAAASAEFHKLVAGLNQLAPEVIAAVTALFGPTGGGAATAIIGIINVIDAADTAANEAIAGGITVNVPAELMAIYRTAKTKSIAYESAL